MQNYYQPEIETASREQIHQWQSERLVKQVKHMAACTFLQKENGRSGGNTGGYPVSG